MEQYLKLLKEIKERGTLKPAAREGMPSTLSLFGYQFRHNLADGFPLLTTKKMAWKSIVTELLWFLRGDTNIKYLLDNGCNIWNEDAYNYYVKRIKEEKKISNIPENYEPLSFDSFIINVKSGNDSRFIPNYNFGDCGYQYGKVWRNWRNKEVDGEVINNNSMSYLTYKDTKVDQIANIISSLKKTPESRRHILTAIDPAHDQDLALYWCHALVQFNCRPFTQEQTNQWMRENYKLGTRYGDEVNGERISGVRFDEKIVPKYYLDCQMYQRSADVVLGVPFNIASYALLTHILCKIVNMIPGEFVHTFGDVHIYENHMDAVEEQIQREPRKLPELEFSSAAEVIFKGENLDDVIFNLLPKDFIVKNYDPHPAIKAELSTGLKK